MRLPSLSLLALLPALALAGDVIDLTASNFEAEVGGADLALVEFFAPWCGHCKNLAPHYEEAATALKNDNIKLAKVDCTENQDVCNGFDVKGYPTLKVFRNGVPTDYTGPRQADGIISYMHKQALPPVSVLTEETHDDFTKSDRVVVVAYGDDKHPVPKIFDELANVARDNYVFGKFETSEIPKSAPAHTRLPAIVLYKEFDDGPVTFPIKDLSKADVDDLIDFVKTESLALWGEIGPDNFGDYAESGLPIAYLFADPEDKATINKIVDATKETARVMRGLVNFAWIDGVKFADYAKSLGVEKVPGFVVQKLAENQKFVLDKPLEGAAVSEFAQRVVNGEVEATVKSEPVPESQDEPVYHLVANGWDDLLGQKDKDLFIKFYAPWCGHCQRLAPTWETLGEEFKGSNVVVAKMDLQENDLPVSAPFKVQGFPTLKFRPAGSDEFVDYNGDRSLESLQEFIAEHSKSSAPEKREETETAEEPKAEAAAEEDEEDKAAAHDEL